MLRYRVKTFVTGGMPVGRFILERAQRGLTTQFPQDFPSLEEKVIEVEPAIFLFVWNRRVAIGVAFEIEGGKEIEVFYPHPLPKRVEEAVYKDVYRQGSLTWSGRYKILSPTIRRFVESEKFQGWLREEATRLGLEVVE
jgi:hypothetical protein